MKIITTYSRQRSGRFFVGIFSSAQMIFIFSPFNGFFYLETSYFPGRTENVFCACWGEKQKLGVYWKFCAAYCTFPWVYIAVHVPRLAHILDRSEFRARFVNFSCKISEPRHMCVFFRHRTFILIYIFCVINILKNDDIDVFYNIAKVYKGGNE